MSKLKDRLLNLFGSIKLCPYPPFLYYYRGDYYKISGKDTLDILSKVVPGDILCRGYDHYLDGCFIPGEYTHSGYYSTVKFYGTALSASQIAALAEELTPASN